MKYGSFGHDARGRRERVVWFSERPARLGGEWAVGCLICAAMLWRLSSEPGAGAKSARKVLSTRMGRFEVRSLNSMQASVIAQHANATCHKKAVAMWLQPGDPVRIALQSTPEDDALLRGGVPQPVDWLRTWRALRTPASFEAAAAAAETEHFICSMRQRVVQPRGLVAMATIQSEVVRERKRAVLGAAWSITLNLDDMEDHRYLRYKCDDEGGSMGHSGLLGLTRHTGHATGKELEDFMDDASREMMEVTLRIIKSFCTDIHGEFDDCLYNHICLHTRTMNPDGCASVQKCCVLLKNSAMPNIVYVGRDPAHIIRRSVELPVQTHERFRKQWSRIFDGKTALIPSIQNSHQSRALFQAAQQRVLDIDGTIGGLTHILRHWSYAKHRHESCADPRGKYACMYVPVALFLGAIAADTRREKPVRERASDALAEMCAADAFQSGLNADYSCRALDFLRLFDVDDHDPSLTWAQKSAYKKAGNTLFVEGFVLCETDDHTRKSFAQIALEQCEATREFQYGDRVKVLSNQKSPSECRAVMRDMAVVVEASHARLDAELHDTDVNICLGCFNLSAWREIQNSFFC